MDPTAQSAPPPVGPPPTLTVRTETGRDVADEGRDALVVGKDPACEVPCEGMYVAQRHLALRVEAGRWVAEDLGSSHGTFLDGERISRILVDTSLELRLGQPERGPRLGLFLVPTASPAAPVPLEPPSPSAPSMAPAPRGVPLITEVVAPIAPPPPLPPLPPLPEASPPPPPAPASPPGGVVTSAAAQPGGRRRRPRGARARSPLGPWPGMPAGTRPPVTLVEETQIDPEVMGAAAPIPLAPAANLPAPPAPSRGEWADQTRVSATPEDRSARVGEHLEPRD